MPDLAALTRTQVRVLAPTAIAVLPIGATEQHAGHLPMGTDALLVDAVLDAALDLLPADTGPVVRAPTLPYGASEHHLFAAAMSIRPRTLLPVLTDLLRSLVVSGFRRLMVVNGHGGNEEVIRLAVKQVALAHPVAAAAASYWALGGPGTTQDPARTPGHAGWFETALMLAHRPDLVTPDLAGTLRSTPDGTPADDPTPDGPPPIFDQPPWPGLVVEKHGEWARVGGRTDAPYDADPDTGRTLLADRAGQLAGAIAAFDTATREFREETEAR